MGSHLVNKYAKETANVNVQNENLAMAINFERRGAFLKINAAVFVNSNPKEIKDGLCKAIDRYYERVGDTNDT